MNKTKKIVFKRLFYGRRAHRCGRRAAVISAVRKPRTIDRAIILNTTDSKSGTNYFSYELKVRAQRALSSVPAGYRLPPRRVDTCNGVVRAIGQKRPETCRFKFHRPTAGPADIRFYGGEIIRTLREYVAYVQIGCFARLERR